MVSRVDKKPVIYNTTFIRCIKPSVVAQSKIILNRFLTKSVGYRIPEINARQLLDDFDDIEYGFRLFGIDEPDYGFCMGVDDEEDDESIRFARVCLDKTSNLYTLMRSTAFMEEVIKIQAKILSKADKVYYGIEGVYQAYNRALWGEMFKAPAQVDYKGWTLDTAKKIMVMQSAYNLIHPTATQKMAEDMAEDLDYRVWYAWDLFKKIETVAIRLGSRKNTLAHAHYSGYSRKAFDTAEQAEDDFELPTTGFCQTHEGVKVYLLMGLRYVLVNGVLCVLSHDDCINLATLAQCYFRIAMYFVRSNGYQGHVTDKACSLIKEMVSHCCRLIDAKKNFADFIRSIHILAQKEFNDSFEDDNGADLGWQERSANYDKESKELDVMGQHFHSKALSLAVDRLDRLNVCFMYHALVGDEMLISDLRSKVSNMSSKVLEADKDEWESFLKFVKAYTLCRFMLVHKKKPKAGGDVGLMNSSWADRCISGQFTMPPRSDWGNVWIEGELRYTDFANTWHLEAQDVAYVVKDSKGLVNCQYVSDRKIHSELLMAMTHGGILDVLTGSTPNSARERILKGQAVSEVVLTAAPKAENAKPSWKKRVTFAADCEFRKMQAEVDKNCRRVMSFIRGPSLGVDQCILEKQFADIGLATSTGLEGAVCSHDISAWSESMDRKRKFEFEKILIDMFDRPGMINISKDWEKINAVVTKQGCKDIIKIDNGSFQGFDGSASTILHSMILIYCIDSARRKKIMDHSVKTNMATLIDDCIALMMNLDKTSEAKAFWKHLKETYLKLGFEVDDLKSIFSNIKAIYLSRRFVCGGEVPADMKVFIKAHSSYEDPIRCSLDIPQDIFGSMRGACDANGEAWFIYFCACVSVLAELAHNHNFLCQIPPSAAAVYALAPVSENGWGFPSIVSWATNDVTDKRTHFNAILELSANHSNCPESFTRGVEVYPKPVAKAVMSIKSQAWRIVSYSNIFTNPFEALRDGPLKPDMLRRNAVQDMLREVATAEPWASLLAWTSSSVTARVRELLIQSGALHAPTLAALVNCMPDNYRLSLVGKAIGSDSLLSLLKGAQKLLLKRRVHKCSESFFRYTHALYFSGNSEYTANDFSCMTFMERTYMEREEFYSANGVKMTDHTFPDPIATFTVSSVTTGSVISPNLSGLRIWDKAKRVANRSSHFLSDKGMYVPRRSGRVWEVTCEYAKGWDSVSQRVAMGLAVLARAEADGHSTAGLLSYFIKSWNESSNITPNDTHLISIHGSIKRLDANPGSATHPVIVNRNILRGFNNSLRSALDSIPTECKRANGSPAHLHDFLAHETSMLCLTALMFSTFQFLGVCTSTLSYQIAVREGCYIAESAERMTTSRVANQIDLEILDGAENYGLLQACPSLAVEVGIPTMKSSWVKMINALLDRDFGKMEELKTAASQTPLDELIATLELEESCYSPSVIIAAEPASRGSYQDPNSLRVAIMPTPESARATGDEYTSSVRSGGSSFSRALSASQPAHIVAATVVRSLIWSRLKNINMAEMAKIMYQDPDADYSVIRNASSKDFWKGAVVEVSKIRDNRILSEMVMLALRSLGVSEIHISACSNADEVAQSVASFFGANMRKVIVVVSDLIGAYAGRSARDYEKPYTERVITHNPSLMNAKLRREHVDKLISSNIEMYKDRIEKLKAKKPTHRGDLKIQKLDPKKVAHNRVVELRCRMYTYLSVKVMPDGSAMVDEVKFGQIIHNAARKVFLKVEIPESELPDAATTFDNAIKFMSLAYVPISKHEKGAQAGWNPGMGEIGARLAYETISIDANMVMNTKFAISASEIAPKIYKKIIRTPAGLPEPRIVQPEEDLDIGGLMGGSDDEEGMSISDFLAFGGMAAAMKKHAGLPIPYWQALYTLTYGGKYSSADILAKLGISITAPVSAHSLREAKFDTLSDEVIKTAFVNIVPDYTTSGMAFNPEWLERDEADAYTTDEMQTTPGGFLF